MRKGDFFFFFKSIQFKLINRSGQAERSSGKAVNMFKATGDFGSFRTTKPGGPAAIRAARSGDRANYCGIKGKVRNLD